MGETHGNHFHFEALPFLVKRVVSQTILIGSYRYGRVVAAGMVGYSVTYLYGVLIDRAGWERRDNISNSNCRLAGCRYENSFQVCLV
jgi:hypothetical protein